MPFEVLPKKASIGGRGRSIVYLDQNVVSEIARLRLGRLKENERTAALRDLSNALRKACLEDQKARCVESFFHQWESSGLVEEPPQPRAEELFHEIWEFLTVHAWGLRFHTLHQVTEFQTLVSVAANTGLARYPNRYLWRAAFESDPHESNERNGIRVGTDLFLIGVPWRPASVLKPGWAAIVEGSRAAGHYASFDAALRELRTEARDIALADNARCAWARKWGDYRKPMREADVVDFISSDAYAELPCNEVLTRIGARILGDHGRQLRDSDGADMRILALAIPYCDLVITDRYVASVANGLRLGEKHSTAIVPSTTVGLREASAWLSARVARGAVSSRAPHIPG